MKGSWYSQECLGTCTSLTNPVKVSMMKETRPFSLQENLVFSHRKSTDSRHMCEVNFEVSSIPMQNMWYLLCLILYIKMETWPLCNGTYMWFFFKISFFGVFPSLKKGIYDRLLFSHYIFWKMEKTATKNKCRCNHA